MRCLLEFPPILAFRDPLELNLILVLFGYLNYLTHGKVFHFYNNSPVSPGYTIQPLVMQGQALGTGTRVVWQHLSLHIWLTAAEFFTPILSLSAVWNLGCSFTVSRSASFLQTSIPCKYINMKQQQLGQQIFGLLISIDTLVLKWTKFSMYTGWINWAF